VLLYEAGSVSIKYEYVPRDILFDFGNDAMPEPEPPLYSVSLLNDDKTPMQFVVDVLETFFNMDRDSATQKMFFHSSPRNCGVGFYEYEVAKKKAADVMAFARQHNHPLRWTFEKALRVPEP
jgi:ATP-dependent Clp protease adaptor protein ClpS